MWLHGSPEDSSAHELACWQHNHVTNVSLPSCAAPIPNCGAERCADGRVQEDGTPFWGQESGGAELEEVDGTDEMALKMHPA